MNNAVGVLALQGAYQKHIDMLQALGVSAHTVRYPHELDNCSALIIPGGESTTISLLIQKNGLYEPIKAFAENHSVMGVCAGMIMMATEVDDDRITPLGLDAVQSTTKSLRQTGTQFHYRYKTGFRQ